MSMKNQREVKRVEEKSLGENFKVCLGLREPPVSVFDPILRIETEFLLVLGVGREDPCDQRMTRFKRMPDSVLFVSCFMHSFVSSATEENRI